MFSFTDRVQIIFSSATFDRLTLTPGRFLDAALQIEESVCKELKDYLISIPSIMNVIDEAQTENSDDDIYIREIGVMVSPTFYHILVLAKQRSEKYGQIYINEGHIIEFIIKDLQQKHACLTPFQFEKSIKIIASTRNLIVSLNDIPELKRSPSNNFSIRECQKSDISGLLRFIKDQFGERWLSSVNKAFLPNSTTHIYIAEDPAHQVIGFACFREEGTFGPMGVSLSHRRKRIGESLVLQCLIFLKEIGREQILIEEAGPIEFYEKTCGAVLEQPIP
ncbi:GNAT family N-acetyltransferase [Halobacillus sp. BBL2006]|uniref:GNAT family N-acetyltransferase n=1 Tax=Halobacillus sp. BBL2006 TaxID=1543706 RepID=UPI000542B589|nr:GNAT family N-acetyltransferase [Halobacillus sp. BBL2006]KHE70571.1 hypothetical protein LD39_11520 [Halobacillus sp. BBL2006]